LHRSQPFRGPFWLWPFSLRVFCVGPGLIALVGFSAMDLSGPHNPLILLPWIVFCFAGAALAAEACVRGVGRI
jgi:hypothetical protein